MSFFKKKPAVIQELNNVTGKLKTSDEIANVQTANIVLSHLVNTTPGIVVLEKDTNEFDGAEYDTLVEQQRKGVFHSTFFGVFPSNEF